jgi:hypothetical protein
MRYWGILACGNMYGFFNENTKSLKNQVCYLFELSNNTKHNSFGNIWNRFGRCVKEKNISALSEV